jgi:inosine-uridine nucleoside N-ribohydrolase
VKSSALMDWRFFILIVCLLCTSTLLLAKTPGSDIDYIIDTDIGGDIDDVIALMVAIKSNNKPLAITTSHIEPVEKAKIAKLILTETGYPDIPVYAGMGVTRNDSNVDFMQLNSLWPPFYGYPNPKPGQKKWYEKQALAYREEYGDTFDQMKIEEEVAAEFIVRMAREHSPASPLVIIALGPLHNIDSALSIDSSIKSNILIYSMGGNYPKGYNWLISPETTARVLAQVKTVCISSEFIENNNLYITPDEFSSIEKKTDSRIGKAIIADWKNWHKIDAVHTKVTQLGDPVTLFLALHPQFITSLSYKMISFPCLDYNGSLKIEFSGCWYSMPGLDNQLITIENIDMSHIQFVTKIISPERIKENIVNALIKK